MPSQEQFQRTMNAINERIEGMIDEMASSDVRCRCEFEGLRFERVGQGEWTILVADDRELRRATVREKIESLPKLLKLREAMRLATSDLAAKAQEALEEYDRQRAATP